MNNKTKAVLYMLFSSFCFALMAAFIKFVGNIPTFEKAFFRNFVSLIIAAIMIISKNKNFLGKKENRKFLFGRGFTGTLGVLCYFYGIDKLLLADSSMLNKMSPFFVVIFAAIFLNEKISKFHILSLILAFSGILLIIKPSFNVSIVPALICSFSAVFAGAAYTFVSYLKDKEEYYTVVFYFSFIAVIVTIPFTVFNFVKLNMIQLLLLLASGFTAALAQFALTIAYKYAPAGEVSIYNYTNVIFSSILGILFFSEFPDIFSIAGYILIILAGLIIFTYGKNKVKIPSVNNKFSQIHHK